MVSLQLEGCRIGSMDTSVDVVDRVLVPSA